MFAAFAAVAALPACGNESDDAGGGFPPLPTAAPTTAVDPGAVASAFSISPLPDGTKVTAAFTGTLEPQFSSDSFGGTKPTLVLVPADWDAIEDHRWIEIQSIDGSGNEGGFHQELPAYSDFNSPEGLFELDGHPAIRLSSLEKPGRNGPSAAFVAINTSASEAEGLEGGDQRGILVTGVPDDLKLFETIARATSVDKWRTPILDDVPKGWRTLGTLNASQAVGPNEGPGPALPIGRRAMQLSKAGSDDTIITAFGGDDGTAQLKAIEASWSPYDKSQFLPTEQFEIDGADAYLLLCCKVRNAQPTDVEATAWFSIDGTPFEVRGPVDLLGTPDLVTKFASTIKLIPDDQWTDAPGAVTTATVGTSTPGTVLNEG